jgi:hypothetical protein
MSQDKKQVVEVIDESEDEKEEAKPIKNKRAHKMLTLKQKKEIIDLLNQGATATDISKMKKFGFPGRSTVSSLKNEEEQKRIAGLLAAGVNPKTTRVQVRFLDDADCPIFIPFFLM